MHGTPIIDDTILESLRNRPGEQDAWHLASALLAVIDALFALEKDETNPDTLRALAAASIDACKDLQAVLAILQDKVKE